MKPNGRDYKTDSVLKRLSDSDHATLILARRVQARGSHIEGFQDLDVHDGIDRGPISNRVVPQAEPDDTDAVPALSTDSVPPRTEEQQEQITTPDFRMKNTALREFRSLTSFAGPLDEDKNDNTPTVK